MLIEKPDSFKFDSILILDCTIAAGDFLLFFVVFV